MPDRFFDEQFLHPQRHNLEAIRKMGYAFVDLITDTVLDGQTNPFVQDPSPLALHLPNTGTGWESLLQEVRSQLIPKALNLHNPRYMGHMDSIAIAVTIWADALTAALNNNMLSEELAPIFTKLEQQLLQWFGQLFGWDGRCLGTLTDGGSLANLMAMLVARNTHFPHSKDRGMPDQAVAFVSAAAHTSFHKAANTIGLGRDRLWQIPTNPRGEMQLDALEQAIQTASQQGQIPFFIAAVAGTTVTGAVDDLRGAAAIARKFGCWFHVDAAYGGAAVLSPQWRHLLTGSELADSITFNPQKWMWVARTCAMLLVRDAQALADGIDADHPYMADNTLNFGDLNLQGTRRTDSLKLWLALRSLGLEGYAQLIDRSMVNAKHFRDWVESNPETELVCEPTVNIVCLRSGNPQLSNAQLRQQWIDRGQRWLSLPLWQGDRILKAVVLHPYAQWSE